MNDELSREARSLIDGARAGDEPDPAARDRVRAKVMATIAAGGAATAGGPGASTGVSAGKVGVALVLAGVIAGVVYLALRSPDAPTPSRAPATPAVMQTEPEPPPVPVVVQAAPDPEPEIDTPPPTLSRRPPRTPATDTLAAERALLAKANRALRVGDADGALTHIAEHQQRYPRGVLIEERNAAKIVALCGAGRIGEGAKAREAFLARWPQSVHASRVSAACR